MKILHKKRRDNGGFTLIEVIMAILILTVGILSLYSMQYSSISTNAKANNLTSATTWANDRIELLLSAPYDCSPFQAGCHDLDDLNGDGTNQDSDNDGVDDVGGDDAFGLNNDTQMTADHFSVSPDGQYTILWNVAVDTPVPNTKTIRVIVNRLEKGITKSVPMTYIKGE